MKLTSAFTGAVIWVADIDPENKIVTEGSISEARYRCLNLFEKTPYLMGVNINRVKIFNAFKFGRTAGDSESILFNNLPDAFKTHLLLMGFEYEKG